jgi:NADH-quinone oxidoreductase subunit L
MAGPTPVSALIHAATMVTAGVYLIARTHTIFALAPDVRLVVAIIGAATLLYAGVSALVQTDVKRVLAYSTISQIGYMFLALGVGAWSAAMFHFMTHAFFKALLFLAAGLVIEALGGEQDMRKMGGLRRDLPVAFWGFLIGAASLSALPLVTAGFYSKEVVLGFALGSTSGSAWLWAAGAAGAVLTALYSFRAVMLVFFGDRATAPKEKPGLVMNLPVSVLAGLAVIGGLLWWPSGWGVHVDTFARFMERVLPATPTRSGGYAGSTATAFITPVLAVLGIVAAVRIWRVRRMRPRPGPASSFFLSGWGFDWLYDRALVWPIAAFARWARDDVVDPFFTFIAWLNGLANRLLSRTQTGHVRLYVGAVGLGAAVIVAITVFVR